MRSCGAPRGDGRTGVHGRQQSTVRSWRKPAVGENTCSEASLTGGSGCRWSLHEGGWAKSFGVAQQRKRGVGRWCSSVNRGSGKEWSREKVARRKAEAERGNLRPGVLPL
jgi:hypothetical protein